MTIRKGEFVALLGSNGAGKTTTLRTIAGLVRPAQGSIEFMDRKIDKLTVQQITGSGISFITDDGCLFSGMSVRENLMMGAYLVRDKPRKRLLFEKALTLFPRLSERLRQPAGTLSGGERKMLAIARGLMSDPKMMLIDEPSLGLAPLVVLSVFETLKGLTGEGVTILLVEQNVHLTLQIVDRGYVLEDGMIAVEGSARELLASEDIQRAYLGIT
ncbi:MAG: ABC transporter ATP-binding protein [Synergistaceae bacterium]|nr:ABC transporter ATP-binding protein [Synergistaceae bacterium]